MKPLEFKIICAGGPADGHEQLVARNLPDVYLEGVRYRAKLDMFGRLVRTFSGKVVYSPWRGI